MPVRDCCSGTTAVHCHGEGGGQGDNRGFTIYRVPGEHAAVAWLCVRAIRPAATILDFLPLVPGH